MRANLFSSPFPQALEAGFAQRDSKKDDDLCAHHPHLSFYEFRPTIVAMTVSSLLPLGALAAILPILTSCGGTGGSRGGPPNMGGPSPEERKAQIATEETGNFFYGRRYHVFKTRFWGYLREPREPWSSSKLVVFNESRGKQPDRLPETAEAGQRYGYDNNYEYRIKGFYTGDTVYEINSNQFLPEFMLTGYEVVDRNPGWLFSPQDHYSPERITLRPGY